MLSFYFCSDTCDIEAKVAANNNHKSNGGNILRPKPEAIFLDKMHKLILQIFLICICNFHSSKTTFLGNKSTVMLPDIVIYFENFQQNKNGFKLKNSSKSSLLLKLNIASTKTTKK